MSLLEKAKRQKVRSYRTLIGEDEMEFAVAWARGEINHTQATKGYNTWKGKPDQKGGLGIYVLLARSLGAYIRKNNL